MKKEILSMKAPRRKRIAITIGVLILAGIVASLLVFKFAGGEENVDFQEMDESKLPKDITADIIPEYKKLERALACKVDDDIYVVVTRGEKPTSGFGVAVSRITMEEKDGKTNLIIYATFDDPQKETAISQIITYPVQVVKTELKNLPDEIELRIQY